MNLVICSNYCILHIEYDLIKYFAILCTMCDSLSASLYMLQDIILEKKKTPPKKKT
jgi:hypothetical protein